MFNIIRYFLIAFFICISLNLPANEQLTLNTLVLTASPENLSPKINDDINGITIKDIDPPPTLVTALQKQLNKPITEELLKNIRDDIINAYRSDNTPMVSVIFPGGQDISNGKIQVLVLEGKLGKIKVEGAKYFSPKLLAKQISAKQGKKIKIKQMVDDAAWINDNPYRSVEMIYQPGEDLGTTDVLLRIREQFPFKAYANYEHNKNKTAGNARWKGGVGWGNLWDHGHQLNTQLISASRFDEWWSLSANYIAPLPWKHNLMFFGGYTKSQPGDISGLTPDWRISGKSWQLGTRYTIPLPTIKTYKHSISAGYDFKRTNNFLSFISCSIYNRYIDISQFLLRYESDLKMSWGRLICGCSLYFSPGDMTKYNHNSYLQQERPNATARYFYGIINIDTLIQLPKKWSIIASGLWQLSNDKLVPSQQLALGGYSSIRGYTENDIITDRGFFLRQELRIPPIPIVKGKNFQSQLQFLGFIDFGHASDIDPSQSTNRKAWLASTGLGARYNIKDRIDIRFDYSFQLKAPYKRLFGDDRHSFAHVGVTTTF